MKLFVSKLIMALSAAVMTLALAHAPAAAQKATTLDELLREVRRTAAQDREQNRARIADFRAQRDRQASLLAQAKADVAREEQISTELEAAFSENELRLNELDALLTERLGAFGELFGVARQVAGDTRGQLDQSLVSAQFPGRLQKLNAIAKNKDLPTMEQLRYLWYTLQQEMTEQGKVVSFAADVAKTNGDSQTANVTRLGPFVAIANGKYVVYKSDIGGLMDLSRQPASEFVRAAKDIQKAEGGGFVKAALDPSLGAILDLQVQTPNLLERIRQGRLIGYIVIALGTFGIAIGVIRLLALWGTNNAVRGEMKRQRAGRGNPLGRIFMTYEDNPDVDTEALELKLDDAILKEIPKLERGLGTLKVLAAIAPMMGLLGTVTGMIQTFQSITLYGTGDPKLMAGGISQALVTTVLGLIAAIPLMLLHSFASGQARAVLNILEEQAAGLVARRAEGSA